MFHSTISLLAGAGKYGITGYGLMKGRLFARLPWTAPTRSHGLTIREAAMNRISCMRASALAVSLALAALAQFSCDDNPADDLSNLRLSAYSGDHQTERVGAVLSEPLVVKVSDVLGNPKPGVSVSFVTNATAARAFPSPSGRTRTVSPHAASSSAPRRERSTYGRRSPATASCSPRRRSPSSARKRAP